MQTSVTVDVEREVETLWKDDFLNRSLSKRGNYQHCADNGDCVLNQRRRPVSSKTCSKSCAGRGAAQRAHHCTHCAKDRADDP
ncbi:hypothetical protein HHL21_01555 [Massilia sp. RP-1-19]|uniref:Uncharacterized protein n=1 Tax=Massilia polaris TaxID=2728846 RepID=A0A848HFP4_9BURK|nr:hypothetical protein [Massilia polaris]NML59792.1 hypothetical protein [Massilia polaris]